MSQETIAESLKLIAELKREWPEGPWQSEPDREDFRAHGLACFVQRNFHGACCGYVGLPPGHPKHGANYSEFGDLEVHGGVTYAAECSGHLCHIPEPGEPDAVWWIGFDCGHMFDVQPAFIKLLERMEIPGLTKELGAKIGFFGGTYRDFAYARSETEKLAAQLAAIKE